MPPRKLQPKEFSLTVFAEGHGPPRWTLIEATFGWTPYKVVAGPLAGIELSGVGFVRNRWREELRRLPIMAQMYQEHYLSVQIRGAPEVDALIQQMRQGIRGELGLTHVEPFTRG